MPKGDTEARSKEQETPQNASQRAQGEGGRRVRVRSAEGRTFKEKQQERSQKAQESGADGEKDGQDEEPQLPLLSAPAGGVPPIVEDESGLDKVTRALEDSFGPIAVDTERAQGRTYGSGAYLLQLKREGGKTFLVDPRAFSDLDQLAGPMRTEWILHAPDQDLGALAELGLAPTSLFDTEIAARLLGARKFGLGALTESYLGVRLAKAHQNEDWSKRPLPESWLSYAALDVELLPELRGVLAELLDRQERSEWAAQEFVYQLEHPTEQRPHEWWSVKGLGRVKRPADLAIAKELWEARERLAQETDVAPGRILTPKAIVEASLARPAKRRDVLRIMDFRRPLAKRNMELWWEAIERAYALPEGEYPKRPAADPYEVPGAAQWKRHDPEAFERLTQVRALVARAGERLDLDTEVVLNGRDQRLMAWWPLDREVPEPGKARGRKRSLASGPAFLRAVEQRLGASQARAWQQQQFLAEVEQALHRGGSEVAALQAAVPRAR